MPHLLQLFNSALEVQISEIKYKRIIEKEKTK